jgi:hypothetical protein
LPIIRNQSAMSTDFWYGGNAWKRLQTWSFPV